MNTRHLSTLMLVGMCGAIAAPARADFTGLALEQYLGEGWIEHGYEGLTAWRVYAEFDNEKDRLMAVHAWPGADLTFQSSDGAFWNDPAADSLIEPVDFTSFSYWDNQWDSYVTIDADSAEIGRTKLSPDFAEEVGDLQGDFTTSNAVWYIDPADDLLGFADGGRVQIAQLTVQAGQTISFLRVSMLLEDGTQIIGAEIPTPGGLALLAFMAMARHRQR